MSTSVMRRLVPVAAVAALAAPALAACSSSSSGASATTPTVTTAPTPTAPSGTSGLATPSIDTSRLSAIADCLKNADLPTPTSTEATAAVSEVVRLLRDPRVVAALAACGVPLPAGAGAGTPSTTS